MKKMPELCFECHKTLQSRLAKITNPHKPIVQQGSCGKCHAPHTAKAKRLMPMDEKDLCLSCHGTYTLGVPPLNNIRKELEGKKFLHGPIKTGRCTGCHDPHGSGNFRLLTGPYPETLYAPYKEGIYDFCLKCHNKSLLRFSESTIYTNFRNGKRNLHYVHVANSRKGRTCRICHAPHASDGEKLIQKDGLRFGEWNIPINFKITATGGSCAPGCHQSFAYDRDKPVVYGEYTGAAKPVSR
jgi:predicted CXXCH cytochrome family protein